MFWPHIKISLIFSFALINLSSRLAFHITWFSPQFSDWIGILDLFFVNPMLVPLWSLNSCLMMVFFSCHEISSLCSHHTLALPLTILLHLNTIAVFWAFLMASSLPNTVVFIPQSSKVSTTTMPFLISGLVSLPCVLDSPIRLTTFSLKCNYSTHLLSLQNFAIWGQDLICAVSAFSAFHTIAWWGWVGKKVAVKLWMDASSASLTDNLYVYLRAQKRNSLNREKLQSLDIE